MSARARIILATALIAASASTALAQFGGGSLRGVSVGLSASTPVGSFDTDAQTGIGLAIHSGGPEVAGTWGLRSNFTFDRFAGKGALDNVQFIGGGFDFMHLSQHRWYQYAGVVLSSANYTYKAGAAAGTTRGRNGSNFGLTGGIGVNFGNEQGTQLFVEFAATTMFTGSTNSNWFPARFGLRF